MSVDWQMSIFDQLEEQAESELPEVSGGYVPLDLSDVERITYGLSAIHTSVDWLAEAVGTLEHRGGADSSRSPGATRDAWAYAIGKRGVWFEPWSQWTNTGDGTRNPWGCRPAYCLEWAELRDLIRDRPERARFLDWAHSVPHPESMWRFARPWELHVNRPILSDEEIAEGYEYASAPNDPEALGEWEAMLSMFPRVIEEIGGGHIPVPTQTPRPLFVTCEPCGVKVNSYTYMIRHERRCAS